MNTALGAVEIMIALPLSAALAYLGCWGIFGERP